MTDSGLVSSYERLLAQARQRGDLIDEAAGQEHRSAPRMRVRVEKLAQSISPWPDVVDISARGIAFHSPEPCEPGLAVQVAAGGEAAAQVNVLACQEISSPDGAPLFRVRCRFADDADGLRMVVAIKAMESARPATG